MKNENCNVVDFDDLFEAECAEMEECLEDGFFGEEDEWA